MKGRGSEDDQVDRLATVIVLFCYYGVLTRTRMRNGRGYSSMGLCWKREARRFLQELAKLYSYIGRVHRIVKV
jgi:hypothetical protein